MSSQRNEVIEVVANVLQVEQSSLEDQTSPVDVELWDSMRHTMMLMAVEEKFNVSFSDQEMVSVGCVGDLVRLVEAHQSL